MFTKPLTNNEEEIYNLVEKLAHVAEVREWDNRAHLFRVRYYCQLLCNGMNIPRRESEQIAIACQLHDVGKCSMPDELMQCQGEFKASEWVTVENHTQVGAMILKGSALPLLQIAAVIAENHHERWNGSGYPNKLRGEKIPLVARIYAVVDSFDALTTPRSYKTTLNDLDAYNLIVQCDGTLFDPAVIKVFKEKFDEILKIKKSSPNQASFQRI